MADAPELALYGHPFSSYTWKALIALYAYDIPFDFRVLDGDHPDHAAIVAGAGPLGKFPVLADGERLVFEATTIIEHLAQDHSGLIPSPVIETRQIDRVLDQYVMNIMQSVVNEYLRDGINPDQTRIAEARAALERSYRWLDHWLSRYARPDRITLIECAAAPALFYADWVHPIADAFPRLQGWRAHLLALPPVRRCVDEARPFRPYFPLGAPDRD